MDKISPENYQVEDFISDESFINYHFKSNIVDQLFWEKWLTEHPGKMALVKEAIEMLETFSLTISEKEYREESKKISIAIEEKNNAQKDSQLSVPNKLSHLYQRKKRMMQYILPLLMVLSAGGYWFIHASQKQSGQLVETFNDGSLPMILTLSDSTVVSLAPHARLQYPSRFDNNDRDVYLAGNAGFNVRRNVQHPFKVHVENIVATVLGTIFNIKTSGDSAIEVDLLKGKLNVEIMNAHMVPLQSLLLAPDEKAVYVRNERHLYKNELISENEVDFRQNSFEEIADKMKAVFGVAVINESNNKTWRFTGAFRNSTAKDIIENICVVKKLSFMAKGDTIFIK